MEITKDMSESAVEILEILDHCSEEIVERIPKKFIDYLKDIQSFDYVFKYDETKALKDQKLLPRTYYLMGLIYKDYVCDENERADYIRELKEFKSNETSRISNVIQNNNINNVDSIKGRSKETALIEVKKVTWVTKLFNKVKKIFEGKKKDV